MKKRDLTKKVLCTVLAASVFGVCGNVSAAEEADKFENGPFKLASDETYIKPDTNVHIENATMTVDVKDEVDNVGIVGKNTITVNGTGVVHGGIDMSVREGEEAKGAPTLTAKNATIYSFVDIAAGTATLTDSVLEAGKVVDIEEAQGQKAQENIRVHSENSGASKLTLNNVKVTGDIMAEYDGAELVIEGGSVNEVEYYGYNNEGVFERDGYTEVHAEKGGKVTVTGAELNTGVSAFGENSVVEVNNSSISTDGSIFAAVGGVINLNGGEKTIYTLGGEDVFMALSGDNIDGETGVGQINLNGGTLKAENLRYLVGLENNPWVAELEKDGMSIVEGGIVLKENGVIETKGDQIFEHGVDVSSDEAVLNSTSGKVTNDAISYVGGTLKLTDEKYSLGYVSSALENLKSYQSNSQTKITMTGELITGDKITIDDINNNEGDLSGAVLEGVTVSADSNFIVGTETTTGITGDINGVTNIDQSVKTGFGVANLDFSDNATGMVITNAENVTLGDSVGGQLITVKGNASDNVKVVVGLDSTTNVDGVQDKTGSFTIGIGGETSDTVYNLTGSVTVNEGSALNVNGQADISGGVELNSGFVHVDNGSLKTDITANGNSTITGAAQVENLTVEAQNAAHTVINIGNTDKAGNVTVANADLQGATVFLDPAWKDGVEIEGASKMAVAGTDGKVTLDGNYIVGQNSVMSFGVDNNEKAQETFAKTGLTWGEEAVTAGLYINGNLNVAGGAVVVDGSLKEAPAVAPADGTFTAAENSVVMVDGQSIKENAAITGVTEGNVNVDPGSKLYIDGAKKGETYHVIDGANAAWQDANIVSDNALLKFEGDGVDTDSKFDVTASYDKINNVYGADAVEIANVVDATLAAKDEGDAAFDFFNAAANSNNNATKNAQIAAFNSAANMGELAGVNHGTYSMSNAMTDAVAHHLSLAIHGEQDKDIWAHYIHNKEDIDGMDLGGIEGSYDAQYNGIVVGSDLYKNGKVTAGVALSYADGNIDGSNVAATTKNDAEYYGASLYGRIDNGNSAILGDISYMHSDNDITQNNSGQEITASADADAFSIGIRAEQAYEAGAGKFVPYAGIRYMHLGAGNYDNSLGMSYDADDQNLWLLPVGVTYSAEVQSGDWTVKPVVEVGYVWTMGDRDTDMTVSLNGAADSFGFETADSGSFIGRLGIEAEKSNVTYGLGYEYQKGDTVKANKWMANLTFSF